MIVVSMLVWWTAGCVRPESEGKVPPLTDAASADVEPDGSVPPPEECEGHGVWEGDLVIDSTAVSVGYPELFCAGYCTRSVTGTVYVAYTDLPSLTGLGCLVGHLPGLELEETRLTSLDGLQGVTSVGVLSLDSNPHLKSLSELDLESVGSLFVVRNEDLTTLAGLESVQELAELMIIGNPELRDLSGLEGLEVVTGSVDIGSASNGKDPDDHNDSLTSLAGLEALSSVGHLSVDDNPALLTLSGLDGLESVGGSMVLRGNVALDDVSALHGLATVGGDVTIANNVSLTDEAAQALVDEIDAIGGTAAVTGNE